MRALGLAAVLLLTAGSLEGQMVVTNDTLDVERREVRDILVVLRDSLHSIEAAAAQFQRGNASASIELLYSRGRTLKEACSRALRNLPPARTAVEADDWEDDFRTLRQNELLVAMDSLERSLLACEAVWSTLATPDGSDRIREDGLARAQSVAQDVRTYDQAVNAFFKALGIYVRPIGAGASPLP